MNARALLLFAGLALVAGCEPSPESFGLTARTEQPLGGEPGSRAAAMVEGDVLVVETTPLDGSDEPMELCVTATSSDANAVEVRRVRNKCRMFVISAKRGGSATVTFSARDGKESLRIAVTPLPEP